MEHVTLAAAARGIPFDVTGTLTGFDPSSPRPTSQLFFRDETGATILSNHLPDLPADFRSGDRVRATGLIQTHGRGIYAKLFRLDRLAPQPSAPVAAVTLADLSTGRFDGLRVTVCGKVTNAFADEVDPSWTYLVLSDGHSSIYAPVVLSRFGIRDSDEILGARLELNGWCCASSLSGARQHLGRVFSVAHDGLRLLNRPDVGLFDAPALEDCRRLSPDEISRLGRRKVVGEVIAVGRRDWFLLRTEDGRVIRVDLTQPLLPTPGSAVEAVGTSETDLYHVNLSAARWRAASVRRQSPPPTPADIRLRDLRFDARGTRLFNPQFHGRLVRLRGIVRGLPTPEDPNGRLYLENDGLLVPVVLPAKPAAAVPVGLGCQVEVTGVCVLESENWRPNAVFPSVKGLEIVSRTAEDLRVLAWPPWWTPRKLLAVIGVLLLGLLAIGAWNVSLRVLAERRGHALNRETIARVASDLKVGERTRLAVELHDSIAQSLTGVSLEIRTAERLSATDAHGLRAHLTLASRALASCRAELRNCLWDLRNHALEQGDMEVAVRQALRPVIGDARLAVRFFVPHERITDNTAHAILRIVRELATNAVQHGRATTLKVAGCLERHRVLLSVRDNGHGFDPARIPGPEEGHFGLQGIRERVAALHGTFSIQSAPGLGARAFVTLDLSEGDTKRELPT